MFDDEGKDERPSGALARLKLLRHLPRELWLVYVLKIMESFAYFASSLSLTVYLTDSRALAFSDLEAGAVYSAWGVVSGVVGMLTGPCIDKLGVRRSLLLGGTLLAAGRILFAAATTRAQVYVSLFFLQSFGMNLAIPVLSIAIRRVTTARTQTAAYGLFYSAMNVAAFAAGLTTDAIRSAVPGNQERPLRIVFATAAVASVLYTLVAALAFRETPANRVQLVDEVDLEGADPAAPETSWQQFRRETAETGRDPVFWRLVAFSGVIFGARTIFRHMDATLPKWMQREIGPNAKYGTVYSINPAIIVFAVPLVQAVLAEYDPYECIIAGTALTAFAPVVLAVAEPSYVAVIAFMLLVSAGEATYSPRLYEYAMVLAPPGREGMYGTLAAAPLFFVKMIVGTMGGELLGVYCPKHGHRECKTMWAIIAATAASTPVGLIVARKFLYNDAVKERVRALGNGAP